MDHVEFMLDAAKRIHECDRFFSYDSLWKSCAVVENIMRELGLEQIRTLTFPSDGVTDFGGWLMPLGWNPKHSELSIISADGSSQRLCSYEETPCSLALYSRSADVTAEVVFPDEEDLKGKLILVTDHQPSMAETTRWFSQGAVGVLSAFLVDSKADQPGFEYLNDVCQWCNYMIPFWQTPGAPFAFSLTPNQGRQLTALKQQGKLVMHAVVEAEVKPGLIPAVTALLPGETDEEIVITGHLFEQGANDNASGVAQALTIVRELAGKKRKRGIRLLFIHEMKSFQAYLNSTAKLPKCIAGLNIDMAGFTLDRIAHIGDSSPVYPNFAPALLLHCLEKYGCTANINPITGYDVAWNDPQLQCPMTYMCFLSDANYHKSSDTFERLSPQFMETARQIALEYVSFLVNAGLEESCKLAEWVRDYDRRKSYLRKGASADMNRRAELARLDSVKCLVPVEEQDKIEAFLQSLRKEIGSVSSVSSAVPSNSVEKELSQIMPKKNFRGFFSLEKYWLHGPQHPEIASLVRGWNAPLWMDDVLMWADGSRNALEIWKLLQESGFSREITLYRDVLQFLKREGYVLFL